MQALIFMTVLPFVPVLPSVYVLTFMPELPVSLFLPVPPSVLVQPFVPAPSSVLAVLFMLVLSVTNFLLAGVIAGDSGNAGSLLLGFI